LAASAGELLEVAITGRALSVRSLRLIVRGLMLAPVVEGMDALLC
jgi:hypothetical protein